MKRLGRGDLWSKDILVLTKYGNGLIQRNQWLFGELHVQQSNDFISIVPSGTLLSKSPQKTILQSNGPSKNLSARYEFGEWEVGVIALGQL